MKIGVQTYTIRDFCTNLKDFSESMKRVADMGYTTIQVSGVCDFEPEWLAEQLKSNGLTCGLTHFEYKDIRDNTEKVIADHKTFGCKYIGIGGAPGGKDNLENFVREGRPVAQKIRDAGLKFMYHNHSWEYLNNVPDGRTVMRFLSDSFMPDEMGFTLDTYWVKNAEYDVIDEIKRLSGRLPVVHYKDMLVEPDGTRKMSWIGGGNAMDFVKITEAFADAGTELIYVEQDTCYDDDPFDCLKKSYDYLKSIGLN